MCCWQIYDYIISPFDVLDTKVDSLVVNVLLIDLPLQASILAVWMVREVPEDIK